MTKSLLIIAAGIEAVHGIRRAKEMGLHVVASDGAADAPGFQVADECFIASTYDADLTAAMAADYAATARPIDGVLSIGADVPFTVAKVAKALGIPGLSLDAARLATDKLAMKQRLWAAGVPVPWFSAVESAEQLATLVAERPELLIVKPVDSRGSRGVVRMLEGVDPQWAYDQALALSPSSRVITEAYLSGPQISTESLVLGGKTVTPGFSDRNYEFLDRFAPYCIENGGNLPCSLSEDRQDDIALTVERAAKALGFTHGTVKGDIVVHRGVPHVIELAPRLSGGYFCTLEIPLSTGVDFVGAAIRLALGEPVDEAEVTPRSRVPVVQRYLFPPPGQVTAIEGLEEARRTPGVEHLVVSTRIGAHIQPVKDSTSRAAMVMTSGPTLEAAQESAAAALGRIKIRTETARQADAMASAAGCVSAPPRAPAPTGTG